MLIFNREIIKFHRNRIADKIDQRDFLIKEIYKLILENLSGDFDLILNLGSHTGQLLKLFCKYKKVIHTDISEGMLREINGIRVALDEEFIPFSSNAFDAIISVATLHRVNDLPGVLIQIFNILKKGGIFVGSLFGPSTLNELKKSIVQTNDGISPMVYPFVDVKDAGLLMQRAGFNMIVSNTENLIVNYKNVEQLFTDLRYMGETNALVKMRKNLITKTEINRIKQRYKANFADENLIPATFEIVTMIGMKNVN